MVLTCRDKWLFAAKVSPAEQHPGMEEAAAPSHINGDPFDWKPQPVAPFDFEMQDGVFRVYDDAAHTSQPFPVPGNSFDFFSDMSRYTCCMVHTLHTVVSGHSRNYARHGVGIHGSLYTMD